MANDTLMQGFEWYLPDDGNHWNKISEMAQELAELGITKMWLPPAFKGTKSSDVGYGVYDMFDLGEFNQKGTVRTKYGFKEDYLNLINVLKNNGISPIADVVLNHKASADATEAVEVVEVDPTDRTKVLSEPFEIEGWTYFNFPGRNKIYNDFEWHWYHFTGTDFDARTGKSGIYQIQGENKGWAQGDLVDKENGNFDYLMYADIDFKHPEVIKNIYEWAHWFVDTTGIEGFRLDAVKHIDAFFMNNFIRDIKDRYSQDFYVFGEYWNAELDDNVHYLDNIHYRFDLIDTRLHMNLYEASQQGESYDLRRIFDDTLVKNFPDSAVTFVENHDTQRGQALQSTIEEWFKPAAYASILLRESGLPCVFYGDYVGIEGEFAQMSFKEDLDKLLVLRKECAYGEQVDYFDQANCIGWTRLNEEGSPLAVLISNAGDATKRMFVGEKWSHQTFYDAMGRYEDRIIIDDEGWADFPVAAGSLSVWIAEE